MPHVVTLIAPAKGKKLDETLINKVFMTLEKKKASVIGLTWLAEDEACDISFENLPCDTARTLLHEKLAEVPVDILVQPTENRKKKLLVSDMDSTMINQECIDEIAAKLGLKEKVAAITDRAMNGELDFKESLRARVALLEGLEESALADVYDNHITLMPGAKELVGTMRDNGAHCLLVSGGFTFFTGKIAQRLGFHDHHANTLLIANGKLTGKVAEPILDKDSKLHSLQEATRVHLLSAEDTLAVGDGANDLPMLKAAGLGIAYHAKPNVQAQLAHRINHTDLTALLYAQGYKRNW